MRPTWKLSPRIPTRSWSEREVLLDFNGPQLVLLEESGELYLSVATDEDQQAVRWLRAKITANEYEALLAGGTTVRDCLLKPEILVVDTAFETGEVTQEVSIGPAEVTETDLPSPRSFLPKAIQQEHVQTVESPQFVFDGPGVSGHSMGFRAIGELLQQIQRLWNAIGQQLHGETTHSGRVSADILKKSVLAVESFAPGSLQVNLNIADAAAFQAIAGEYRALIRSVNDNAELRRVLHRLKSRVRTTFSDYLTALRKHQVNVLTRWEAEAVFITHHAAERVSNHLTYAAGQQEERLRLRGYFSGFSIRDARFDFFSVEDSQYFSGLISPRVFQSALAITIKNKLYDVEISISTLQAVEGMEKDVISLESVEPLEDQENGIPEQESVTGTSD